MAELIGCDVHVVNYSVGWNGDLLELPASNQPENSNPPTLKGKGALEMHGALIGPGVRSESFIQVPKIDRTLIDCRVFIGTAPEGVS